jgi:hypothetical protein
LSIITYAKEIIGCVRHTVSWPNYIENAPRFCLNPKMLPGTNAFEISDIQEDEAEASPDDQNVTMLHSL